MTPSRVRLKTKIPTGFSRAPQVNDPKKNDPIMVIIVVRILTLYLVVPEHPLASKGEQITKNYKGSSWIPL